MISSYDESKNYSIFKGIIIHALPKFIFDKDINFSPISAKLPILFSWFKNILLALCRQFGYRLWLSLYEKADFSIKEETCVAGQQKTFMLHSSI